MAVSKEDIEKIRAQGLTHFAALLESASVEGAAPLDEGTGGSGNTPTGGPEFASLFEGQGLDEAFVTKANALFEAAVETKVQARMAEVDANIAGMMESFKTQQEKTVNDYLDTVVKEWLKENELKIYESSVVEQAKAMIAQVKAMFEGMGIEFDDQALAKKLSEAEAALEESTAIIEAQEVALARHDILSIVAEAKTGLSEAEASALQSIVDETEYEGIDKLKELIPTMVESAKKSIADAANESEAAKAKAEADAKALAEAAKAKAEADAKALAEAEAAKAAAAAKPAVDPLIEATIAALRKKKPGQA